MSVTEYITDINDPRTAVFTSLTEAQLRNRLNPDEGLLIAESPKVINVALDAGYTPVAMLCEEKHITGDAAGIIARAPEMKVYTGARETLASITGYKLTRGVLCAMRRKTLPSVDAICRDARRVVVIDGVTDTTNIGAIFRSAAALGIDGVLLTRTSCDPLNRRSIRVSMGSVFLVPWTWLDDPVGDLREAGFTTAAMALTDNSVPIDDKELNAVEKLAVIMGTEGDGLAKTVIEGADYVARIPMAHGVDSLNVAAAAAVAFWQLRAR
ncbi:MAG: RNA methyltransferase [Muribaculaceae bacterium]|nr:RNA methyltransferase [Muribaculaceae bacterium]MDE6346555.1 RNA methyltransferase [Muribaculaceae bacterium]